MASKTAIEADRFATREEVEETKRVIEELRFGRFNAFARRTRKLEERNV